MAEQTEKKGAWMTPKEIGAAIGTRKAKDVFEDVLYNRRPRREILDLVMEATGCNEYSAQDYLREVVKPAG